MPWYAHAIESFAVTHTRPAPPARVEARRGSRGPIASPVIEAPEPVPGVGSVVTTRPRGDMYYEQGLREPAPVGLAGVALLWTQFAALRLLLRD